MGFTVQNIVHGTLKSYVALSQMSFHLILLIFTAEDKAEIIVSMAKRAQRENALPRVTLFGAPNSQLSSFARDVLDHPRTLGHPLTASSSLPDLAEILEGCLDSSSSVVNIGEGFSYLRVTSHSPSCRQPKQPSACRLQISAKLDSKSMSLNWSPNRYHPAAWKTAERILGLSPGKSHPV